MQPEFQIKPLKRWELLFSPWACYKQADHEEEDGRKRDGKEGKEELIQIRLPHIKRPFCALKYVARSRVYLQRELDS